MKKRGIEVVVDESPRNGRNREIGEVERRATFAKDHLIGSLMGAALLRSVSRRMT